MNGMFKRQTVMYMAFALIVVIIGVAAVFGPGAISRHFDDSIMERIVIEEMDDALPGYVYNLSADEKLYVLSNALNNRIPPQSDYYAAIRMQDAISNTQTQSYAFQPVYKESEYNDETRRNALLAIEKELAELAEAGILPEINYTPDADAYSVDLFTAIDVLEPKKNVTVWQVNNNGIIVREGLLDCVMDAHTNQISSVSIRAEKSWEEYDVDAIIQRWAAYLGASAPEPYDPGSPLTIDATHYRRYSIGSADNERTIVTVGFYEGINEFFIKISK